MIFLSNEGNGDWQLADIFIVQEPVTLDGGYSHSYSVYYVSNFVVLPRDALFFFMFFFVFFFALAVDGFEVEVQSLVLTMSSSTTVVSKL